MSTVRERECLKSTVSWENEEQKGLSLSSVMKGRSQKEEETSWEIQQGGRGPTQTVVLYTSYAVFPLGLFRVGEQRGETMPSTGREDKQVPV